MPPLLLRRRAHTVEAMKVERDNLAEVAVWCKGVVHDHGVYVATDTGQVVSAQVGAWVLRGIGGEFYPAPDAAVWAGHEAVV